MVERGLFSRIPQRAGGGNAGQHRVLLKDTRVRLTVFNVFDQDPPLAAGTFRFGTIEQRQQHYAINFTRQF